MSLPYYLLRRCDFICKEAGISRIGAASEVFLPVIVLGFLETADTMGRARLRFKTLEMAAVLFSIFISEHSTHL